MHTIASFNHCDYTIPVKKSQEFVKKYNKYTNLSGLMKSVVVYVCVAKKEVQRT